MESTYKFGTPDPDNKWVYPDIWSIEPTNGGGTRLVIAPSRHHIQIILDLLAAMREPFRMLDVLVVARDGAEPGRYQSSEHHTRQKVATFLQNFAPYLENDGRHNIWIASHSTSDMLVYDRHNVIYRYGQLAKFQFALSADGFTQVPQIRFPSPHAHHYHATFDSEESRLLSHWSWHHTPMRQSDDE